MILDTELGARVAGNPHVTRPGGIRFYAGVPLKIAGGPVIGTVCAIDVVPRKFDDEDLEALKDLAAVVAREIELRQLAGTDPLTGLLSRRAFQERGLQAARLAVRHQQALSCIAIDIDHFKQINDTHGHAAGDKVLMAVANACEGALRTTDLLGRIGGEEFSVLLPGTSRKGALDTAEKLRRAIRAVRVDLGNITRKVTASIGVAALEPFSGDMDALLDRVDEALYAAKNAGRDRVVVWQGPQSAQRRVLKAGRIVFNDRFSTIDCTIRSLGDQGAGVDVWNPFDVPDRFTLEIGSHSQRRECKVTARAERHVEVAFI